MDIKLADGTIVKNVPKGVTPEQVQAKFDARKSRDEGIGGMDLVKSLASGVNRLGSSLAGMADNSIIGDAFRAVDGTPMREQVKPSPFDTPEIAAKKEQLAEEYLKAEPVTKKVQKFFSDNAETWNEEQSAPAKNIRSYVNSGKGFVDTAGRYLKHPSAGVMSAVESLPMMAPLILTKNAPATTQLTLGALHESAANAEDARQGALEDAKRNGATAAQALDASARARDLAFAATMLTMPINASGGVNALRRLTGRAQTEGAKHGFSQIPKQMLAEAGQEFLQEGSSKVAQNMGAQQTYAPDRNVLDGAAVAGLHGAVAGGIMGGAMGTLAVPEGATPEADPTPDSPQPTPQASPDAQAAQARKAELDAIRQQRPLTPEEQEDADVADAILARNAPEGQPEGEQQPPVQDGQPVPQPTPDPAAGAPIVGATPQPAGAPVGSNIPQPPEPPQPAPGLSGVVQRHTQSAAPALDTVFGDAIKGNQVPDFTGLAQQTGLDRNALVDQFNAKRTEHVRKQGLMDLAEQGDLNALRSAVSGITVDPQQQDQLIEEAVAGNEQRKASALAASQQQDAQAQQQAQQAAQQQADKDKYDQTYGKMLDEAVAALEGGQTEVKTFLPIKKKYSASGLNATDVNGVIDHAKQVIAEKQQKAARHEQAVTEAMPHLQSGDEASAVLAMEQAGVTDDADVQSVLKEANKRIRQDSKKPAGTQSVPAGQQAAPVDQLSAAVAEVKAAQAAGKKVNLATIAKKHGVPILDVAKGVAAKPEQAAPKAKPSQPLALPAPQGPATTGDVMVSRNGKVMSQAEADALAAASDAEKKQMRRDMAEEAGNPTGIPSGMKPKVEKPARTEQKAVLPNLILRTDGKPFPDAKQATRVLASKKLEDTHEVVSVEGGKAIAPKKQTAKNQVDPEKDDILSAIAKLGGIDRAQAKSQGVDPADFSRRAGGIQFVFRKNGGKELDRMAEALSEMGYPVTENGDYTVNALLDSLDSALHGNAVGTPQFHEAKAQAMYEEEAAQREIDAMFDSTGNSSEPDWLSFGADDFVSSILDGDITPNAVIASELAGIENERTVTGTPEAAGQKVDSNPAPSSGAKGIASAVGGGTERQQKGKGDSQPDSAVQDFGLKAQTEAERLAEEQGVRAALDAKTKADEQARLKAQADKDVSSFTLTGSNRPADVAMAAGQNDLFAPKTRGHKEAEKNLPKTEDTISDADYAQVVEAAKYLKDIVYSLDNLLGDDKRLLLSLSSPLGKSGRDTILMDTFGIDRNLAHTIHNRMDDSKPHKLRDIDMTDALDTFPMLKKIIDDVKEELRLRDERKAAKDIFAPQTRGEKAEKAASTEPVKWFGSRDKAEAWIAKNGPDYHVVQAGPSRFEVFAGKKPATPNQINKQGNPARKRLGVNYRGETLYEDEMGVRSYATGGVLVSESVSIIPGKGIERGELTKEYKTADELAAEKDQESGKAAPAEDLDAMFDDVLEEVTGKPKVTNIPKASVESAFTGEPDPKNSAPMQELGGFAVGDKVSISGRSVSEGVIRQLFTRQSAVGEMSMARVDVAGGKSLDLLTDNLSRQERTAGQAAVSAAKNTGMALGDAIDGLGKLFGGNRLSSGLTFDEDTYAKAKPYFIAAISHLRAAGGDLREAMRAVVKMVVDKFGADAAGNMKPYVVQFIADVRDGKIDDPAATLKGSDTNEDADNDVRKLDTTGAGTLEGVSSGEVQNAATGRGTGSGTTEGGRGDGGADRSVAGAGGERDGGVGNSSERVPVPGAGARGPGRGRSRSSGGKGRAVSAQSAAGNEREPAGGLTADANQPSMALEPGRIDPPQLTEDFIIEDDLGLGEGGQRTKYKNNVEAIRLIRDLEATGRTATTDEQKVLAKYVGWGGIPQAFDPDNKDWSAQYAELKALLSADEWDAAFESTQYAHYTSREIINGMYAAVRRLGFNGGNVLEAGGGVGNFIGLMPVDLRTNGKVTLIERENIAAAIAKHLYPRQNVRSEDFTEFGRGQDGQYDMQIGNPPFSSNPLTDKSGRKHLTGLSVHNYFITKGVDMLRDGGIMAVVVSNSFMDAGNVRAREYIAKRAKLLGAIRLPNNAFSKNANTQVTTDIIFLQKLPESDWNSKAAIADGKRWVGVTTVSDPQGKGEVALNQYFADNRGMMLGMWGKFGTMYGPDQPALVARPGQDTAAMMARAVAALPEGVYAPASVSRTKAMEGALLEKLHDNSVGEGGFYVKNGKVWQRVADSVGEAYAAEITPNTVISGTRSIGQLGIDRLRQLAELRSTMRELLAAESEDRKADMDRLRKELNTRYDAYTADNGRINDQTTKRLMRDDPDYPLIAALEMDYEPGIGPAAAKAAGIKPQTSKAKKAAIFDRRVIEARKAVTKADSPQDAINISMAERGRVDAEYIGRLLDVPSDEVLGQLASGADPLLFRDPATDEYVLRDAYLSGNVREKLKQAKAAGLTSNARALEEVQPEDIPASKISARIGSPWVPVGVYADFAKHLFGEGTKTILRYVKSSGGFSGVIIPGSEVMASTKFGTKSYHGDAILLALMNNRQIKVMTKDGDGKPTVDAKATEEANSKADDIKQAFQDWIFKDADRAEVLVRAYNDSNNNYVVRKYDGSWLKFPGKVPDAIIRLRRHQRNAIARTIQDRTTLYDHVVGAGKTFTAIASAMEMRRMGLVRKPLMVVPNHLVGQWAADFYRLYPGAKVLAATKKDFERENRRRFLAKIASGDWDAVIIAHSSFERVRPSSEFEQKFIQEEIDRIMREAKEVDASAGDEQEKKRTVKQLASMQERLENRIAKLREKPMDDLLDFQQLGVDQLFVDEAHLFKNLMFTTKMQNIRGLNDPTGSQRAYDMYIKTNQIMEMNGRGQGVVFMTGTPVSNSLAEMYHMMRYLMPIQMQQLGFESFDAWANTYADINTMFIPKPSGDGFKQQSRFSKFANVHQLLATSDQVIDTVTMDDIKAAFKEETGKDFPLPKLLTGRRQPVPLEKTPRQEAYMKEIVERLNKLESRKGPPKKGEDNHLSIMSDSRKAAMDIRLADKSVIDREENGRVDRASNEIFARWQRYDTERGVQLVFADLGTPVSTVKSEVKEYDAIMARITAGEDPDTIASAQLGDESAVAKISDAEDAISELDAKGDDWLTAIEGAKRGFSVYDDLKKALMEKGVPDNQIAFIHSFNTDDQKAALFRKVNSGEIRILMGSTAKMGAGTNVQKLLVALHHLDVPWKPSDLEQREGRIIRQGNELADKNPDFEVEILAYVTKDTLDSFMWSIQEAKLKGINQLRSRNIDNEMPDAFAELEMSAGEMQAAATGNTDMLREIQLRTEVQKLERKQRAFDAGKSDAISGIRRATREIENLPSHIATYERLSKASEDVLLDVFIARNKFKATINGKEYTNHTEAAKVLRDLVDAVETGEDGKERKAKLDVTMNGEQFTNRQKLAEAFARLTGDNEPFVFDAGDGKVYRVDDAADAVMDTIASSRDSEGEKFLGNMGGYRVSIEYSGVIFGGNYEEFDVHASIGDDELPSAVVRARPGDDRHTAKEILKAVRNMVRDAGSALSSLRASLEKAKKNLADLSKINTASEWPDSDKLTRMRDEHRRLRNKINRNDGSLSYDVSFFLAESDGGTVRVVGKSGASFSGQPESGFMSAADAGRWLYGRLVEKIAKDYKGQELEMKLIRKDSRAYGAPEYVVTHGSQVYESDGEYYADREAAVTLWAVGNDAFKAGAFTSKKKPASPVRQIKGERMDPIPDALFSVSDSTGPALTLTSSREILAADPVLSKALPFIDIRNSKDGVPEGAEPIGEEGYYHNGRITLFADNIRATKSMTAEERLKWVAFHEVTHRGVANLAESQAYLSELRQAGKNPYVKNLAKKIYEKRKKLPPKYHVTMEVAIEEALAEISAALRTGNVKQIKEQYGLHFPLAIRPRAKSAIARFFEAVKRIYSKLTGRGLTNEQVGDLLRKTHEAGMGPGDGPKGGKKFSASSSGDQKVHALFRKVQEAQRFGKGVNGVAPELAFDSRYNPGVDLSGAFATAAEHIGDLVHRAAMPLDEYEAGAGIGPGGASYGLSALREKTSRFLGRVKRGEDLDHIPQASRNAEWNFDPENKFKKASFGSVEDGVALFKTAAQRYADAYKQVPVYTELQQLARDAAIALGEFRHDDLLAALEKIDVIVRIDPRSKKASQARAMESYFALLPDVGNDSSDFSADTADIRYSAPPTDDTSLTRSDFVNIAKEWMFQKWANTLGTQLNTAMLEPLFKPTYDLVQRYLQHTSNDAYDAISAAPNLLGRLEDINDYKRDIKNIANYSKVKADREAAAVPLFEGTRFDKKVYSDAVLKRVYNLTDDQVAVYREARAAIEASLDSHAKSVITKILLDAGAVEFSDIDTLVNRDLPADDYMEELRQRLDADILAANDAIAIQKTALSAVGVTAQDKASIQASIKKGSRRVELLEEAAKRIDSTEDTLSQLKREGYFPLMRWGKYSVTVRDAGGKVVDFRMVDGLVERKFLQYALKKQYQGQGMTVTTGTMDEGRFKDFRGISPETLALFAKEMGVDNDAAYQEYLKLALPGQSALKRRIHRKGDNGEGIAGFSMDIQRTLAAFVMGNARHSARNIYSSAITKSVDAIPDDDGGVRNTARKLAEFVMEPDENSASVSIRNMLFIWNMGGSVAFAALNLTQPWMMTLPWLSQFSGVGDVAGLMGKAAKTAASAQYDGTVPPEYYAEYQRAVREGIVDPQNVFMLQGVERGKTGVGSGIARTLSHGMGMFAAITESYNRKLTLFAALDVAKAKGPQWLKSKGFDSAYAFAKQAIAETQGVYNKGNRPAGARNPLGAIVLVFKQYAINWTEMAVRMGRNHYGDDRMRKGLMMMLGLLFAMAGAMGMPGAEDLKDIAETAMGSVGKPVNIERQMQMTLGKGMADAVMAGPMNALVLNSIGLDMHGRMSMGNIVPITGAFNPYTSTDAKLSEGISVMGAGTGLLKKGSDAVAAAQDGRFLDAAQSAAPRAVESIMKGVRMMAEGKARDARGNVLMETTPAQAVSKMLDFQPASVAITQRERGRRFQDKNIQVVARASLRNRLITAYEEKDAEKIRGAEQALDEWNQDNPLYQIKLKKRDLRRAAKKRGASWLKREETPKGLEWMDEYADQENGQ